MDLYIATLKQQEELAQAKLVEKEREFWEWVVQLFCDVQTAYENRELKHIATTPGPSFSDSGRLLCHLGPPIDQAGIVKSVFLEVASLSMPVSQAFHVCSCAHAWSGEVGQDEASRDKNPISPLEVSSVLEVLRSVLNSSKSPIDAAFPNNYGYQPSPEVADDAS